MKSIIVNIRSFMFLFIASQFISTTDVFSQKFSNEQGFGGAVFNWSQLAKGSSVEAGGLGAKFLTKQFYLGGAGYGIESRKNGNEYDLGYGGILGGYVFNPNQKIHFNMAMLVGFGGITERLETGTKNNDFLTIVKPTAEVDFKIAKWFKIGARVGYRKVWGSDEVTVGNSNLSSFTSGIALKFGNFYSSN